MKLEVIVRYLLNSKRNRVLIWIIFLLLFLPHAALPQEYKITFPKDTPLSEALLESSRHYNFKVAFDARRLQAVNAGSYASGENIGDFLSDLLKNTGFRYVYKHGSYLILDDDPIQMLKSVNTFQLMGFVSDESTGEQLPFATVLLPDQNIFVMASTNGTFSIKNIVSNPVHILINYIGYDVLDTFMKWTDDRMEVNFRLRQKISKIDSVDVIHSRIEMVDYRSDVDFAATINPSRMNDMPALVETDIFRTLQLLPGIRYSETSSELSIRGGTSDQNLILFDGQTLYNLSHYYGVFSSINASIVKDIQVYRGGFDSRYGERISGIVDITGKSGNQMKPSFSFDMNLLSVNLAVEVPVTKRLTFIAAGRRSYSDIYSTSFAKSLFKQRLPILQKGQDDTVIVTTPSFHFYDLNGKLNYRISDNENISLSLYGGKDFFENSYHYNSRSLIVSNTDSNSWHNYGISINWQKQWNTSFFSNLLAGYSGYRNSSANDTRIDRRLSGGNEQQFLPDSQNLFKTKNLNELTDLSFSIRNTYFLNSFNQLNFGLLVRKNDILYYKDADQKYVYDNTTQSASIGSLYLQDRLTLFDDFDLKPGFRISYYNGNHKIYVEPRFAAKYSFSEHVSGRVATGLYNQFISQVSSQEETGYNKNFWVLTNDSVNPVLKAVHFIAGLTCDRKKLVMDVEGYYKQYSGVQEYIYISQFLRNRDFNRFFPVENGAMHTVKPDSASPSYFLTGSGVTYGIDLFASFKSAHYTNWISYSLSKSTQRFDGINNGEEIPALTDQRHQISFSNLFSLGRWNLGAIVLFASGRPYIASTKIQENKTVVRDYERLPNYFRTDLSANYTFLIKALLIKTGISIINLFNNQNYYDVNTRTFDFENTTFSETSLIQSQDLSLNLFLHISL